MKKINIDETNLYKKNLSIHKKLPIVYGTALIIGLTIIIIKGLVY